MTKPLFPAMALALLLAGCAGAPPPKPLPAAPSAEWSAQDPALTGATMRFDWWTAFGSPELDRLVDEALAANHEIAAAQANLRAARAIGREARLLRLPQGGVGAGIQRLREPSATQPPIFRTPGAFPDMTIVTIGGDLAWEIDLVGGRAKTARAALADARTALWQRRQAEASVAAQVVRAWLDLTRSRQLSSLADARIKAFDNMIAITARRVERGGGTEADLAALRQTREQLAADRPALRALQNSALRRLAVLTARDPVGFVTQGAGLAAEVRNPSTLLAHDPRTVLRMRPDVQIAEARLAAAFERAGASRAALYPSLSLGASGGLSATPADLAAPGAFRFAIGPAINWGIFNLGRVKAAIASADAASEIAAAQWQQTLLVAVEEADGAIDSWVAARKAVDATRRAETAASILLEAARSRQRAGAAPAFVLAQAEADQLAARIALAGAEATERDAWASANLALGAGWHEEGDTAPQR